MFCLCDFQSQFDSIHCREEKKLVIITFCQIKWMILKTSPNSPFSPIIGEEEVAVTSQDCRFYPLRSQDKSKFLLFFLQLMKQDMFRFGFSRYLLRKAITTLLFTFRLHKKENEYERTTELLFKSFLSEEKPILTLIQSCLITISA